MSKIGLSDWCIPDLSYLLEKRVKSETIMMDHLMDAGRPPSGIIPRIACCLVFSGLLSSVLFGQERYKLEDFSMPLERITSEPNQTWVNSGTTTVNPEDRTVTGVNDFYAPPLAATNFNFSIKISVDGVTITDRLNYGKGDVGLLYSRGIWYPHEIVREGTYHHFKNGRLVSFGIVSELVPLFGKNGFVEKISFLNRSGRPLPLQLTPVVKPGNPVNLPLTEWNFARPHSDQPNARPVSGNAWSNGSVTIQLNQENDQMLLKDGEERSVFFTVLMTKAGEKIFHQTNGICLIKQSQQAWEKRLDKLTKHIPVVKSNIDGLEAYYKRSILTGLVCIWENPAYALDPFPSECGLDGGAACLYPWGLSYAPNMFSLMFDRYAITIARKLAGINLQKYYAYTLDGHGIGLQYAYDTYAYAAICSSIFKFFGPQRDLFEEAERIIVEDEKRRQDNLMIDYGEQHNILEMRSAGWEHFVVSPNAERVAYLEALANMGKQVGCNEAEIQSWNKQAGQIKLAIQKNLWDGRKKWFACVYPNGYRDFVYSIQVFDALRAGVCTADMKQAILSHLRAGDFLSEYGVESISKEDSVHHEVVDSDWSGGGAYSGDGPQVALMLYEQNEPEKGWDVLKRFFWMGKQLLYFPQEHLVDNPKIPGHKRSAIFAGLIGAETILFGLAGFCPDYNGQLSINPRLTIDGNISVTGFGFRGSVFDVYFSKTRMKVIKNGALFYEGPCRKIRIQE
jgi:hypothetical protein